MKKQVSIIKELDNEHYISILNTFSSKLITGSGGEIEVNGMRMSDSINSLIH